MNRMIRSIVATLVLAAPAWAGDAKPARPSIYDAQADANAQVEAAATKARDEGRRLLVMFGGDWCGWCHKLHELFASDPAIRDVLRDRYVLVMVDTKAPHAEELLDRCKGDYDSVGYPFLAVLDADAKVLTRQKTDPLEEGDHHDPAKVKAFLDEWAPPEPAAAPLFAKALARAATEDKRVFLHFGTPTCGWCRKLEAFLARDDMASIFARDFVNLDLDLVRNPGADDLMERYNPGKAGGVPWFVFLDSKGEALVNSVGPKGNIGHPAAPEEIEHFVAMLKKVSRRITPAQIDSIAEALRAEAAKNAAR